MKGESSFKRVNDLIEGSKHEGWMKSESTRMNEGWSKRVNLKGWIKVESKSVNEGWI